MPVKRAQHTTPESLLNEEQKKLWDEIKVLDITLYGLAEQKLEKILTPFNIVPEALYVSVNGSGMLPVIEKVLNSRVSRNESGLKVPMYSIEMDGNYMVLKPFKGKVIKDHFGNIKVIPG